VALNTRRAAEEAAGTVRWLRPDFQNPAKKSENEHKKQEQTMFINQAIEQSIDSEIDKNNNSTASPPTQPPGAAETGSAAKAGSTAIATRLAVFDTHEASRTSAAATSAAPAQPWPPTLPEQVRAVAAVLAASPVPLSVAAIEARFKGKGPWKKGLPLLLQTLQALGRTQPIESGQGEGGEVVWRG
jgi:hypothetical protein